MYVLSSKSISSHGLINFSNGKCLYVDIHIHQRKVKWFLKFSLTNFELVKMLLLTCTLFYAISGKNTVHNLQLTDHQAKKPNYSSYYLD